MIDKIKNVLKMVKEGRELKDKLSIFLFYCMKPFGAKKLIFNTTLRNKVGVFICDKNPERIWHSLGDYESSLQKYLKIEEGTFLDIGAHVGRLSIQVAKLSPKIKVVSVEAESSNFKVLLRNIKNNRVKNILPLNLACSNKDGVIEFFVLGEASGGNSILRNGRNASKKVEVISKKVDSIVKEMNLSEINLIKIDVEGAESLVLEGARKTISKFKPKIVFEAWTEKHLVKIKSFLESSGYRVEKIDDYNNYLATFIKD